MGIPIWQTTLFEFDVDLQGMAADAQRSIDVNALEMYLPQGAYVTGGYVFALNGTPGVIAVGYPSGSPVTDAFFASNHTYPANGYAKITRSSSALPVIGKDGLLVRVTNRTTPIPAGTPVPLRIGFKLYREYE